MKRYVLPIALLVLGCALWATACLFLRAWGLRDIYQGFTIGGLVVGSIAATMVAGFILFDDKRVPPCP